MLMLCLIFLTTVLSTAVMCYVAIATPIGPWIAPTIALVSSVLFRCFLPLKDARYKSALLASSASVGGIIGIAAGNCIPTLFFINQVQWQNFMQSPLNFFLIVAVATGAAALLGFFIADLYESSLIGRQRLAFPVGHLVSSIIDAQQAGYKIVQLAAGALISAITALLQYPILFGRALLAPAYQVLPKMSFGLVSVPSVTVRLDALPMLLAIGFVSGSLIAVPLLIGAVSKIVLVDPLNYYLFRHITPTDFGVAFASGIVVSSALLSVLDIPHFMRALKKFISSFSAHENFNNDVFRVDWSLVGVLVFALYLCNLIVGFSFFEIVYMAFAAAVCSYQLAVLAGKLGIAPLGRFATFVLLPALAMFRLNPLGITLLSTFIEVAGGVAADSLFGRKALNEMQLSSKQLRRFQLFAICVSVITVGVVVWLLATRLGFATELLPAQRAHARALLVSVQNFDLLIVVCGLFFGFCLRVFKLNPLLVFGGLLMPLNYSLLLIIGGLLPRLFKNPSECEPFWSGMFAANSLCELVRALLSGIV